LAIPIFTVFQCSRHVSRFHDDQISVSDGVPDHAADENDDDEGVLVIT
jgi:hypothetical protein